MYSSTSSVEVFTYISDRKSFPLPLADGRRRQVFFVLKEKVAYGALAILGNETNTFSFVSFYHVTAR